MVVLALVVLATDAHAELRPKYGGTVEATLLGTPATFDPVAVRSHADATTIGLVYDTLYTAAIDGSAVPHLAAGPPVLDEKKTTVRIELRKGVVFHDHTALAAQDVAASLERARTAVRWLLPTVTAVRADGDAIELQLAVPTPELALQLALPQLAVTKGGKSPGPKAIGSGPFELAELDAPRHRLALKAFDDHFAGRPYVDRLELRWYDTSDGEARRFETGNAHLSARGVSAFSGGHPTFASRDVRSPTGLLVYIGFGTAHAAVTREPAFRRALDLALARGGLATIGSGEDVAPTRVPLAGTSLDAAGRAGDIVLAKGELATAAQKVAELAPARVGALRLEILVEDTRPDDREIGEKVGLALDRLGIRWTLTPVSGQVLRDRIAKGQTDLFIGQLAVPQSPAIAWAAAFGAGGDDWPLASLQAGAFDPVAAAKAFATRLPIVPLFHRALRLWARTDVHGVVFDGLDRPCFADLYLFGAPTPAKARP